MRTKTGSLAMEHVTFSVLLLLRGLAQIPFFSSLKAAGQKHCACHKGSWATPLKKAFTPVLQSFHKNGWGVLTAVPKVTLGQE